MNKISKIIWSLFSGALCLVYKPETANADYNTIKNNPCTLFTGSDCQYAGSGTDGNVYQAVDIPGCKTKRIICTSIYGISTFIKTQCTECQTGYIKKDMGQIFIQGNGSCKETDESMQQHEYICECTCSNCPETGSWTTLSTGYQKYTGKKCDCSSGTATCVTNKIEYRCASGYYGTTTNGTSGCTKCPTPGTSLAHTNSDISKCYIPANTTYSDTYGQYAYDCLCPYDGKNSCGSSSSSSAA